jgi:hypothetical protein
MFFDDFNQDSKVWVYTAHRSLSDSEVETIQHELSSFLPEWASHGTKLYGRGGIYKNRFVILSVDENAMSASGCSIDSSVRFIKELGAKLDVDFFKRTDLVVETENGMETVHISDLKDHMNDKVYNPMVSLLKDLDDNWLIPVANCPFV